MTIGEPIPDWSAGLSMATRYVQMRAGMRSMRWLAARRGPMDGRRRIRRVRRLPDDGRAIPIADAAVRETPEPALWTDAGSDSQPTELGVTVNVHGAARTYAAHFGWSVVPLVPRGKPPHGRLAPHGWKDASSAPTTIDEMVGPGPVQYRDRVRTVGPVVIDIDPDRHADEDLAQLEDRLGDLPATVETITGSGGRHIYFRDPGVPVGRQGRGGRDQAPPLRCRAPEHPPEHQARVRVER